MKGSDQMKQPLKQPNEATNKGNELVIRVSVWEVWKILRMYQPAGVVPQETIDGSTLGRKGYIIVFFQSESI